MAVARTREKGRGRRWERRRGAPRFCRAAPGCALRRFFDPQRSRKSLLEVRCECPGPPKMYIDVLGSWDTGGRRLTINSGFSYYPSTPDFALSVASSVDSVVYFYYIYSYSPEYTVAAARSRISSQSVALRVTSRQVEPLLCRIAQVEPAAFAGTAKMRRQYLMWGRSP